MFHKMLLFRKILPEIILVLFLCLNLPMMVSEASAASAEDARQFVNNVGKHVLDIINATGKNKDQRQKQLQQMFVDNVDIAWMGRFVLGHDWQQATEDQRNRYMQAYRQYLLAHYTTNFADYTGAKYNITGVNSEEDGQFTINMQIKTSEESQDTLAGYRLRSEDNGQFKIIDIIIEGVSLITTERSEFSAIVQQKGIDGLISAIEAKTKAESDSGSHSP